MAQVKFLIIVLFSITIQSQEFNFSCSTILNEYVSDWFDDAESQGMVFPRNGIINWVSNSTRAFDPDKQFAGVSVSSCTSGYEIYINKSYWDHPNVTESNKKRLIYHEMGHAVLEYDHVCNTLPFNLEPPPGTSVICLTNTPTRPFNYIWNDIMWSSEECTDVCTLRNIDRQRYERYWNKTDYIPIQCGVNKGIDIIYD